MFFPFKSPSSRQQVHQWLCNFGESLQGISCFSLLHFTPIPCSPPLPSAISFLLFSTGFFTPTPTPFSISLRLSNSPVLRLLQCLYQDQGTFLFSKLKGETEFTWPSAKASVNLTNISKHQTHRCWWEHSFKQNSHVSGTTRRCYVSGHEIHTCIKVKSFPGYGLSLITLVLLQS